MIVPLIEMEFVENCKQDAWWMTLEARGRGEGMSSDTDVFGFEPWTLKPESEYMRTGNVVNMRNAIQHMIELYPIGLFVYDTRDNLIALTDAEGNTTIFTYDLNNRLIAEERPGGETVSYDYYESGWLKQRRSGWKTRRFWWHGKTKIMNDCKCINEQIDATKLIVVICNLKWLIL